MLFILLAVSIASTDRNKPTGLYDHTTFTQAMKPGQYYYFHVDRALVKKQIEAIKKNITSDSYNTVVGEVIFVKLTFLTGFQGYKNLSVCIGKNEAIKDDLFNNEENFNNDYYTNDNFYCQTIKSASSNGIELKFEAKNIDDVFIQALFKCKDNNAACEVEKIAYETLIYKDRTAVLTFDFFSNPNYPIMPSLDYRFSIPFELLASTEKNVIQAGIYFIPKSGETKVFYNITEGEVKVYYTYNLEDLCVESSDPLFNSSCKFLTVKASYLNMTITENPIKMLFQSSSKVSNTQIIISNGTIQYFVLALLALMLLL